MKRKWCLLAAAGCFPALVVVLLACRTDDDELPDPGPLARPIRAARDWVFGNRATYALCSRDIEFTLLAVDGQTGEAVPRAAITVRICPEWADKPHVVGNVKLVTDESGRAPLLLKKQMCEDVIRPFRKTVTLVNWSLSHNHCQFDLDAEGYQPLRSAWLGDYRYQDKGYSRSEHFQRVEYKIPLTRK